MKNNMLKAFALAGFAAAALGMTACSDLGTCPTDPAAITMSIPTTFELNGAPTEFTDVTLETPMAVEAPGAKGRPVMSPFDRLLQALNLTPEQKMAVKALQDAHKACATAALDALRAAERTVLDAAKAQSDAIKEQVKAGTMSKEDARAALRALNTATRDALKNLPERAAAKDAMKACDDAFLARLRRILTPEQNAILDKFIAARDARSGKGPGNPGDGGKGPRDGGTGGDTGGGTGGDTGGGTGDSGGSTGGRVGG